MWTRAILGLAGVSGAAFSLPAAAPAPGCAGLILAAAGPSERSVYDPHYYSGATADGVDEIIRHLPMILRHRRLSAADVSALVRNLTQIRTPLQLAALNLNWAFMLDHVNEVRRISNAHQLAVLKVLMPPGGTPMMAVPMVLRALMPHLHQVTNEIPALVMKSLLYRVELQHVDWSSVCRFDTEPQLTAVQAIADAGLPLTPALARWVAEHRSLASQAPLRSLLEGDSDLADFRHLAEGMGLLLRARRQSGTSPDTSLNERSIREWGQVAAKHLENLLAIP